MFFTKLTIRNIRTALLYIAVAFTLAACGGGDKTTGGVPSGGGGLTGAQFGCGSLDPAPATSDINAFCNEFWSQSNLQNNCATCHSDTASNPQEPLFVRSDNINQAYAEVLQPANSDPSKDIVDVNNPSQSYIIDQMLSGHHCWATPQVCADIVLTYIENWVGSSAGSSRTIQLTAPANSQPPGGGKEFPANATDSTDPSDPNITFEQIIYTPLLRQYCQDCHESGPGDPLFAGPDLTNSYILSQPRMNLDDPASSRYAIKLMTHTVACWNVDINDFHPDMQTEAMTRLTGDNCSDSSLAFELAIKRYAQFITSNAVDPSQFLISDATTIPDGIVAAGGARYEPNQIALYEFKSGQGSIAYDTSGAGTALDLSLNGGTIEWVGGWGIAINGQGDRAQSSSTNTKLYDLIQATGEYSVEAWVAPNNVTQENARIINYSGGGGDKNFALSQTMYNYNSQVRNANTDLMGEPPVSTLDADEVLQATLQHVVNTYDPVNGRQIYVNGELVASGDLQAGGSINNWSSTYSLVLGDERGANNDNNLWKGVIKMVSIHNRALNINQIQQNFTAGVGEKFFLLFDISHIQGVPAQSYIKFTVSQFDNYSYLFTDPTYVNLDLGVTSVNIPIRSMRIGVNSNQAPVGQAYYNLDTTITANNQLLSTIGTTVAAESGADQDEFYLIFEALGSESRNYAEPTYDPKPQSDLAPASAIGLRTFDEINATMSAMTGVSTQAVKSRYALVKQQLPADANINTFVTAHNIGLTQLAVEYCDVLVNDAAGGNTGTLFGNYDFSQPASAAFVNNTAKALIIDPLLEAANGYGMDAQMNTGNTFNEGGTVPDASGDTFTTKSELIYLIDNLCGGAGNCGATAAQTRLITKAVCTATIASANTLIQ
ncbi:MAG: LamG domain-containing protein [Gammaproteobacteria bacterium]